MKEYRYNDTGDHVRKLQLALLSKGFKLPKYGADGHLGGESWDRLERFAEVEQLSAFQPVPQEIIEELLGEPKFDFPDGFIRVKGDPGDEHGWRKWTAIDTIVLHQTGIWLNDTPERFATVDAHVGILAKHKTPIVQMHDLQAYCYHANKANKFSVGIEINGHFPGLVELYDPKKHTAEGPSTLQIEATRRAIQWICAEVSANSGHIKYILPHRCSNGVKRSDPGEVVWKEIGLWAQEHCYLSDRGGTWTIGDGKPIPTAWGGTATGVPYG